MSARAIDITGMTFGHLTVIRRVGVNSCRQAVWLCSCDCGVETTAAGKRMRSGEKRSCGCRMREGGVMPRRPIVSYAGVHKRLNTDRGKATVHICVDCNGLAAEWSYIGGDPKELRGGPQNCPYSLDQSYYVPRCHSCHRRLDQNPSAV